MSAQREAMKIILMTFFLMIYFFTLDNMYLNKTLMVFKVDHNCLNDHYLFIILLFLIFTFLHRKLSTFQTEFSAYFLNFYDVMSKILITRASKEKLTLTNFVRGK